MKRSISNAFSMSKTLFSRNCMLQRSHDKFPMFYLATIRLVDGSHWRTCYITDNSSRRGESDLITVHNQNMLDTAKSFPIQVVSSNINHLRIFYTGDSCVLLVCLSNQCTPTPLEMQSPTMPLLVFVLKKQMQQRQKGILAIS